MAPWRLPNLWIYTLAVFRPRSLRPDLIAPSVAFIDWHALRAKGYDAVVIDKDNCLTIPNRDELVPDLTSGWEDLKKAFGPERVLVVSNSAGTRKDLGGVAAESVSRKLGVPVLVHRQPKPGCSHDVIAYFRGQSPINSFRESPVTHIRPAGITDDSGPYAEEREQAEGYTLIGNRRRREHSLPTSGGPPQSEGYAGLAPKVPGGTTLSNFVSHEPSIVVVGDRLSTDVLLAQRLRKHLKLAGAQSDIDRTASVFSIVTTDLPQKKDVRVLRWLESKWADIGKGRSTTPESVVAAQSFLRTEPRGKGPGAAAAEKGGFLSRVTRWVQRKPALPIAAQTAVSKRSSPISETPKTLPLSSDPLYHIVVGQPATPAQTAQGFLSRLPPWAKPALPYLNLMRVDKPIGWILLFWPCAWSITLASTHLQLPLTTPLFYLPLFALGAIIMRGAGCTINDMWDARIDRQVERTKTRPLANGDVTMVQAGGFLVAQLGAGLGVLTQLNWYSILLGASSLSLVTVYPFMKRITYYPQIVLGLAFNWGALLGWSAVAGAVDWTICVPMYAGGVAWCVMYDTIYAHQDKLDDVLVNVKSTALRFGDNSRLFCSGLSISFISLLSLTGYLASSGPFYYLISCGGAAAHLAWQMFTVDFDDRPDCWSKFVSNGYLGGVVWVGMVLDYFAMLCGLQYWM